MIMREQTRRSALDLSRPLWFPIDPCRTRAFPAARDCTHQKAMFHMTPSSEGCRLSRVENTSSGTIATTAMDVSHAYAVVTLTIQTTDFAQKRLNLHPRVR
jgi:hypothetical protein